MQNIVYLGLLLQRLSCVDLVYLVCSCGEGEKQEDNAIGKRFGFKIIDVVDAVQNLDVIIELGMRFPSELMGLYRSRGGRLVSYMAGNAMIMNFEAVASGLPYGEVLSHGGFDATWITPQHVKTNFSYAKITRSSAVYVAPHIWDPIIIRQAQAQEGRMFRWRAPDQDGRWKIANFEPNVNVVKTFHLPLLVCENAHRINPHLIEHVFLLNTYHLSNQVHFEEFIGALNLGREGRISAEPRLPIMDLLSLHANAVVAHQWENELNYHYWDSLYGGFPLIHNSDAFKDVGYYYPNFDARRGGEVLIDALVNHENNLPSYKRQVAKLLWTFSIDNPEVQESYHDLLQLLFINCEAGSRLANFS